MIPAVVLTAGLATRLRPLSNVRAKSALPVGGLPLATHILRRLASSGITEAVLNLHHLPATLTGRIGDGTGTGVSVRYSWEPQVLGSAGGPRQASALLHSRRFFIVNGDTLTQVDLRRMLETHRESGALVTMAVIPNPRPDHYSGLTADDAGNLIGVVPRGAAQPSFHFIGIQVAEATAFESVDAGVPLDVLKSHYFSLLDERRDAVRLHVCETPFLDIGTPADYVATCRLMSRTREILECGERTEIDQTAHVDDSILWDDVHIGPDVHLRGVIVTDGVHLPAGQRWENVILRRGTGTPGLGEHRSGDLIVTPLSA